MDGKYKIYETTTMEMNHVIKIDIYGLFHSL